MKYVLSELQRAVLILALVFVYLGGLASQSAQGMQSSKEIVLAASTDAVELTGQPVRVKLASEKNNQNTSLYQTLESLPASRSVYLVLTGLHAVKQPGTLFHLYLDLPADVPPTPGNTWHIGSVNFYNAVPVPDAPKDKPASPISIDITGVIRKLGSNQKLTPDTTVTIMATHPPETASKPMIGHIAMIAE